MKQLKDFINEACCGISSSSDVFNYDPIIREFNNLFSHTNVLLKRCPCGCYYLQGEMINGTANGVTNPGRDGFLSGHASVDNGNPFALPDTPSKVTTLGGTTTPIGWLEDKGFAVCDTAGRCLTDSSYKMNTDHLAELPQGRDILYVVPGTELLDVDDAD